MNYSFEVNDFVNTEFQNSKKAIVGSDSTLTWLEFEKEVSKLIELFRAIGLEEKEPVIIYGHKEAHIIVAKAALLIYGAVYVPSDIIFPLERIKMMKEECNSNVLINCTESIVLDYLFNVVINLPSFAVSKQLEFSKSKLENKIDPSNKITYVLFTSGSTGRPKGVPIAKNGVAKFSQWISASFGITHEDVLLNISSLSFDFASFDEYLMLSLGATIVTTSSDIVKSSEKLIHHILEEKATVWISTPGLVYLYLMEPKFNSEHLPLIKSFVFAGESLPLRTYHELRKRFPRVRIWNAFGPSEATNLTTSVELTDEMVLKYNAIPIGFPKPDSAVFVNNLDEDGVGEICISGEHLTPGYLNNEMLNEEKFVQINSKRTYKTGDQGYSVDGILFYSGRNDDMVKFHGYRIELEDITSVLKEYKNVINASTIGLKNKGETKKLISFCISDDFDTENITAYFKQKIPEYMIPSEIIFVQSIPLNSSDKVDKKELERIYLERKNPSIRIL